MMSNKLREAAKRVADLIENDDRYCAFAAGILRAALAEPEQAPVAYIRVSKTGNVTACAMTGDFYKLPEKTLLYPAPLAEPAIKESLTVANPVAWMSTKMAGVVIAHQPEDFQRHPDRWQPLYAAQMLLPATEYICKCGLRVTPHRCKTDMEF